MRLFREYVCRECGHKFRHAPIISNLAELTMCIDPAPSYGSLFKSALCTKCGSKKIDKVK